MINDGLLNIQLHLHTGLDPSSPGFRDSWLPLWRSTERLDKDDATFVDVIHTARGIQGISKPIGHIDFYPNDGKSPQPGCNNFIPWEKCKCYNILIKQFYRKIVEWRSSSKVICASVYVLNVF